MDASVMEVNSSEARAYGSLLQLARSAELARIANVILSAALEERHLPPRPERLAELAAQVKVSREEAITPFGNALEVLERGPKNEPERALASALAAQAFAVGVRAEPEAHERIAAEILWLAAHTAFDATGLLDLALGTAAAPIWKAVADRIRRADLGTLSVVELGESAVGALALASSQGLEAVRHAARLAAEVREPKIARALRSAGDVRDVLGPVFGEIMPAPLSLFLTILYAVTGILLAMRVGRLAARVALAYKTPAEAALSQDGGVRVRWRVEMLGRTVSEHDVMVPRSALVRAVREVRYPRAALYSGLLALTVGSYVGMAAAINGIRAASPSLLGCGLGIVGLGLAFDFVLASLAPGARGLCRVLFVPRTGATLCVGGVEARRADAFIGRLERP